MPAVDKDKVLKEAIKNKLVEFDIKNDLKWQHHFYNPLAYMEHSDFKTLVDLSAFSEVV